MIGTWLEASARSVEVKTLGTLLDWAGHVCEFYFQEFIQAPQRLLGAGEILGIYDVRGGVGETLQNLPKCYALNKICSGKQTIFPAPNLLEFDHSLPVLLLDLR